MALLRVYRALLRVYRALLRVYRALLRVYKALLRVYRALFRGCVLQCVTVCCSVLQCVTVCCSVLQCVAVCCSALDIFFNLISMSFPLIHVFTTGDRDLLFYMCVMTHSYVCHDSFICVS